MDYRDLGKTGIKVGVVGLGPEHLVGMPYSNVEEVIDASLSCGMNIYDMFMPQREVREAIGKALKGRRKDVVIQGHIGSVVENGQASRSRDLALCKKYFDEYYELLGTDYIDIGMMFFVDNEKDYSGVFETGFYDYVTGLKKEGRIRAIGASSHNPLMAKKMVEAGAIDVLMFSINPAYDMMPGNYDIMQAFEEGSMKKSELRGIDPTRSELYELCAKNGVGITVMKTLGAGRLISEFTPFDKPLSVAQCIHYALTRPGVASCLIGCKTRAEVEAAVAYCGLNDEQRDFSEISNFFLGDLRGKCVYCNHCLPCPSNIDVAATTKLLDIATLDRSNIPDTVRAHYNGLLHKASECIECGNCEDRCPFDVKVIENMRLAGELFE